MTTYLVIMVEKWTFRMSQQKEKEKTPISLVVRLLLFTWLCWHCVYITWVKDFFDLLIFYRYAGYALNISISLGINSKLTSSGI